MHGDLWDRSREVYGVACASETVTDLEEAIDRCSAVVPQQHSLSRNELRGPMRVGSLRAAAKLEQP